MTREWAEDHGYQHINCGCGWNGWTDTGVCERCADNEETCKHCGEPADECTCKHCLDCGERIEDDKCMCELGPINPDLVIRKATVHMARKDHNYQIKTGDTYRRVVLLGHRPNGPRWMWIKKELIKKAAK